MVLDYEGSVADLSHLRILPTTSYLLKLGYTVILTILGGVGFAYVGAPLPYLFGPMTVCLVSALIGRPLQSFGVLPTIARTILGVAVGASITVQLLYALPGIAASVALIPIFLIIVGVVGTYFFRRWCGFDFATAYYAAMPGGLQDMISFGTEAGGDGRALSLAHTTRVVLIVTLAPIVLVYVFGAQLDNPIGAPIADIPPQDLVLMLIAALGGWRLAVRIKLFGAALLGPLAVAAAFSLAGVLESRPPAIAIIVAQYFIGTGIGAHYVGITAQEISKIVKASAIFTVFLVLVTGGFAFVSAAYLIATPTMNVFLAFAPGGQAEITTLSIIAGAELGFVILHHVVRIVVVILGAPIIAGLIRRSKRRSS